MRNHLVVAYGGGGFRGKWGGVERGFRLPFTSSTCAGDNGSAGSHRGGMAVVLPPSFQDVALTGCSGCAARAQLREKGEGVAEEGCTGRLGEDLAGARE